MQPLQDRPLIFLDIDGVLITIRSMTGRWPFIESPLGSGTRMPGKWRTADPLCAMALRWIVASTGAGVVLSSMWRGRRVTPWIRAVFESWGLRAAIPFAVTPQFTQANGVPGPRGEEIAVWRRLSGHRGPFAIIDDDDDMGDLSGHLVQTDFAYGLTWELAAEVIAMLGCEKM